MDTKVAQKLENNDVANTEKQPTAIRPPIISADTDFSGYIEQLGLVLKEEGLDVIYRRTGFASEVSIQAQNEAFGRNLRAIRKSRKLNREELGKLLNVSAQTIGRYERAEHPVPIGLMIRICEVLGCMPIELLGEGSKQLWGLTEESANINLELTLIISRMSFEDRRDLLRFFKRNIANSS